jgi:hypothetical protein
MRNTSILLGGVALALVGAVATPSFAHTHHRHITSAMHQASTPAERQQTAQLNQQQLAQAQNATNSSMAVNNPGGDSIATQTNVGSNATGTATQQNGLTTEPTSYQRTRGSSGAPGTAGGSTDNSGTATGAGAQGVGEDQQVGSPMNGNLQGNPSGAVSPPPPANPSGTPQQ